MRDGRCKAYMQEITVDLYLPIGLKVELVKYSVDMPVLIEIVPYMHRFWITCDCFI